MPLSFSDTLQIDTGQQHYPILIGEQVLGDIAEAISPYIKGKKLAIVTDETVAPLYLPPVIISLEKAGYHLSKHLISAGEASKSFASFQALCESILATEPDRKTTILALGGGVVGDLAGFVASVLLRGLPFIQIPTTLLSQVDSSVGGKTAINCQAGKNLIGSFYQPQAVIMDMASLDSLPKRELLAGYAEVLKYGLLGDAGFYAYLLQEGHRLLMQDRQTQRTIIRHCCAMKAAIVSEDEKEQGKRALLNLGHTFGHAIEKAANYDNSVLHGEAVAIGCLMAMSLSATYGYITAQEIETLKAHYHQMGLPVHLSAFTGSANWDADTLTRYCFQDKKAESGGLTFILLETIGKAVIRKQVPIEDIIPIFREYLT